MISERGYASLLAFVHSLRGESLILHRTVPTKNMGLFYRLFPGRELSAPARRGRCLPAPTVNSIRPAHNRESGDASSMGDMLKLIWWAVIGLLRSMASLEAEILTLRHQLNMLRRKPQTRLAFSNFDRLVFAGLNWIAPRVVNALVIVEPETVIRWPRRQTEGAARNSPIDPRHELG